MLSRVLKSPNRSFFLFGPRATGKSTWLKQVQADALRIDLLSNEQYFRLSRSPSAFSEIVLAEPKRRWIVVDEVQRIPALLNEVQRLMEDHGYRFALTGSSARKLKRGQANLLAGRASLKQFFPLVWPEFKHLFRNWDEILSFGTLPQVLTEKEARLEILEAYAGTYLREEIKEEALTRNVDAFSRFLDIASLANGQVTNLSSISRDAAVARATVGVYFDILSDTLIGNLLPAWTPRARVKEVGHPKFYFFDCGVTRAIQGRLRDRISDDERGHLLETYVFQELRAFISYSNEGGDLAFWRTANQVEVDFIWRRGKKQVAIEVKASTRWRPEWDMGMETLAASKHPSQSSYGVYLGKEKLRRPWGTVLPLADFLDALWSGKILGGS